ncbi:MAG: ACGX-repeat peptide [Synergistaceae bacterium]|nr:ACGX-repeat peptide [Synergistaceae bacterium]
MNDYESRIERAKQAITEAKYILIGGGAGLSDAAGLKYSGKRFADNFAPFIKKYGFTDLYTSSFYPFKTHEERWAYWAKHIAVNRYEEPPAALYQDLLQLVRGKEYFALTTNVEHQFVKAGFPEEKVFAVQGDYGLFQCAMGCHNTLYVNESQIKLMVSDTNDCRIPSALVPKCPVCGGEMDTNLRHNEYFVQDKNWYQAERLYRDFIRASDGKRIVYLELGVGFNTPGIIRLPFEQMTYQNEKAALIRVNRDYPRGANENERRTIAFTEDMAATVAAINRSDRTQAIQLVSINKISGGKTMNKLNALNDWTKKTISFLAPKSAQGYLCPAMAAAGSCGSSCGAGGDKPKDEPKPGSCGAGDDKPKDEPKPSACGSSCGASEQK